MPQTPQPFPVPSDHEDSVRAFVAMRGGQAQKARAIAELALPKRPNDRVLRFTLAQSLSRTNAAAQAVRHMKRLVQAEPKNVWYRVEHAHALNGAGHAEEALAELDHAFTIEPDHDLALLFYTEILRGLGRGGEAWAELAPRIDTLPRSPHTALALGGVIPPDADAAAVLDRLSETAHDPEASLPDRRGAFFVSARILDRRARYEEAWTAATAANHLVPSDNPNHHAMVFAQLTPEFITRVEPADVDASGVVLVCGMPRSGTTVTEQIIAAHPRAATAGEFNGLPLAAEHAAIHAAKHGFVPSELTTKLAKTYLKGLREQAGGGQPAVVVDKLPVNVIILGLVARLLPGLRVIRCLRDPRDVAVSCYMQDFGDRLTYRTRLDTLAEELLLNERVAERWRTELGDAMLESSLEQLVADPAPNARRLLEHAGLDWDEACLRFHERKRQVLTLSTDQVRVALNPSSVGRWKNYAPHLGPLIERLTQGGLIGG